MSAATCQVSAPPDRLQWHCEPLAVDIVCTVALLESIRRQVVDGFCRLSHGGLESGGLLFGRWTGRSIEILRAMPLDCEHKLGPSFILSPADEASLQKALATENLGTLQPLGLYMSHSRRGFAVVEADIQILDRYFPEPWQMALLLMPSKLGPTRAGFFFRGAAAPAFVCAREITLTAPERRPLASVTPPREAAPLPAPVPVVIPAPIAEVAPEAILPTTIAPAEPINRQVSALDRLQAFLALEHSYWRVSRWNLAVTLSLLVLFVTAAAVLLRPRSVSPPFGAPLRVTDLGEQLRIDWDASNPAVRAARSGLLEIREGESKPITIPIARSGLDSGSAYYVPQSGNIDVRLKLVPRRGASSEFVAYFIDPTRHAPAPAPVLSPETSAPPPPPPAITPVSQALSQAQLEPQPPAPPKEPAPRAPAKQSPAEHTKTVKVFRVPPKMPTRAAEPRVSINLPDPPDLRAPASPALPLANAASLTALFSPPRAVGPPQLHSGHLIWTGELRKNTVLAISSAGASFGVLNGRLPGTPVKINVLPAELADDGIVIFTKDEKAAAARSPINWNGWKVFFNEWDPKRIADIDVQEPPSAANNWKRLVLRNGRRNASVVVVDWERTTAR